MRRGFTLVEILIVVVILGILSAVVVPQFASATSDTQRVATVDQLTKIRRAASLYYVRNFNVWPSVTAGNGTWGTLIAQRYLLEPPVNTWVGGANATTIVIGTGPDTAFHRNYGWIYNPATGDIWAAGYDGSDQAFARQ